MLHDKATPMHLLNARLLAILTFGFASGLPLVLTGATLQAWFTDAHVNIKTIGALSLVGIPYTLKFLWAPLMDYYSLSSLGRRKTWILLTQFALFLSLLLLSQFNPSDQANLMSIVAFAIAFFSASQDLSINAYTVDVLRPEERGLGAAYSVFAYRIALLVSGGLALISADFIGWKLTYEILALIMLLNMLPTFFAPSVTELKIPASNIYKATRQAVAELWQRDKIILLLMFIFLYKFGDALALSLITNFLLHGLGFSLTEVGAIYKTVSIVALILGGFLGGLILTRWNIYRALFVFGLMQAFSNLMFVLLAYSGKDYLLMTVSVFIENFCSGLSTAALFAFMMSQCDRYYTATQFALFSAVASLGRVFLGPLAAILVLNSGWTQFFMWSFILCFPGLLLLQFLKKEVQPCASYS